MTTPTSTPAGPAFEPAAIPSFTVRGPGSHLRRGLLGSLLVAGLGLVTVALGWWLDPSRAAIAYLTAFMTCLSVSLGALIFLASVHAMNGKWPVVVRRLVEASVAALLPLLLGFVPIALGVGLLYPWTLPHEQLSEHTAELLAAKHPYFVLELFWARAALYFGCWLGVAIPLRRWSARQDFDPDPSLRVKQRILGALSLPLLALTMTFACFDWMMSLDPTWYSTVFGVYVFAGGFVAAIALLTIATTLADRRGSLRGVLRPSHYYALGRLLLAFVIFWAYIAFFQFMLIWMANRPEEVRWYLERTEGGWLWLAIVIIAVHFVIPFLALLSYRIKWRPVAMSVIAALILVGHWLEMHWMIVPATHAESWTVHWVDVGAIALVAGVCAAYGLWSLHGRAAAPRWDPALGKGARYDRV